ncbi:acyltransferase family-domain-containing protein [Xylariomycetidae sp. FL2044]|nr:acyltransferase family-domain-containing protein [Xylariomycetidae sp. FL2044]
MAIGKEGNVKWVDGLRGLASTLVVLTHIARAFDDDLFLSVSAEGASPRVLQLPFLRVLAQGRIGVSIFALVTGYVCALKPLKLFRQNNQDAAFTSIAKSALRRVPRLIIPCTVATIIIWVMTELGMFKVGRQSDCWWCSFTSAEQTSDVFGALKSLLKNTISTWTEGRNDYDGNMWTLLPLLRGSMQVYVFLMATSYVRPVFRMIAALVMYSYFYIAGDAAFGMQFFWGVFLCDLQNHPVANDFINNRPKLSRFLATVFMVFGLYVASYPEGHPEWATWSHYQFLVLSKITPGKAELPRYGSGIGLQMITLAFHFSPLLRDLLSGKYLLWLGKQSFAVYLLHGPLLRSVLCWMVYGIELPSDVQNENGDMVPGKHSFPNGMRLLVCLPLWIPLNYGIAMLWTGYVDPWAARMTEKIVGRINLDRDEKGVLLPQ